VEGAYDAGQIQVLEGLEPVRKRPGMYIGSTGIKGLHQLLFEVVDNAIDEMMAGHGTYAKIYFEEEGWVTVEDDGRGIPTDIHPKTNISALETVLTVLHAGGKFGGESSGYSVSGGLHGVGVSVVNALSSELEVTVWRGGNKYTQRFSRGIAVTGLETSTSPAEDAKKRGTRVRFMPDDQIFKTTKMEMVTISSRLRELAFLNAGAKIELHTPKPAQSSTLVVQDDTLDPSHRFQVKTFQYEGGLVEYVKYLTRENELLHPEPISVKRTVDGVEVELAMQWVTDSYSDTLLGYANSIRTVDGGTHVDGLKTALTRTVNMLARKFKHIKEADSNFTGENIREGLSCIVSVKVPNPEFEGQTKTRLGNPEVRKIVDVVVSEELSDVFITQQEVLAAIAGKALQAMKAAEAAKRARELVRRKSVLRSSMLPGKLADCSSSESGETEIFLVEGDSAGGSAKQARDRKFQAILPLRGKILNVERKEEAAIYKNQQVADMIVALGLGLRHEEFTAAKLRYGKIIILTDADVDGAHIRTLLLTFLFRYQRDLFAHGHVYVGVPPLYKVEQGRSATYCYSEQELGVELKALQAAGKAQGKGYTIQRFKGLGEMMPQQLWETTMDPQTRHLKRLTLDDAAEANSTFTMLMSDKVGPRREFIETYGPSLQELDI